MHFGYKTKPPESERRELSGGAMEISITTANGKNINLEVDDSSDTIDLKIHGATRRLVLRLGPEPDPDWDPKAWMRIYVSTFKRGTFNFMVEGTETIENVMDKVQCEGGPSGLHQLIFQGEELENGRTLADYKIKKDSTLVMLPHYSTVPVGC
ncbi:unnamed protein product [Thlaspi arvense]|uniref:Ubiquitin-like domain-containing protein n=1 Tax=Thlaspi arvense TaxID=13288 RepID=A0AAU9T6L9_THLAR|nr:unnamed protein product [Thlaspi arvense]